MHKTTKKLLWFSSKYPPCCWIQGRLIRRALLSLVPSLEEDAKFFLKLTSANEEEIVDTSCLGRTITEANTIHDELQQTEQEDMYLVNNENTTTPAALVCLLKACTEKKDLNRGIRVHSDVVKRGLLQENVFLGSTLVNMYAKCGALAKAQEVFDELPIKNVVMWNSIITGYAQQGLGEGALSCFEQMQCEGLSPDAVTFTCVLKACGGIKALNMGHEIHDQVIKYGFLEEDMVVGTALVDMYAKCGSLGEAQKVFDELQAQDAVGWNALIAGYNQHGHAEEALTCFERMQLGAFSPNAATFCCLLTSCGSIRASDFGQDIHANIVKVGLLQQEEVGPAVVDMYTKCSMLDEAEEVFNELLVRSEVPWNVLIAGCAQQGHGVEALNHFTRMQCEGLCPDVGTFTWILKGCGTIGALDKGQEIHARIVGDGLLVKQVVVGTALVDMYASCGLIGKAHKAFDDLPDQDVVSWTALIGGYAQHGQCKEALNCFKRMQIGGFFPNVATYVCTLKACGSIGASVEGQEIHAQLVGGGFLAKRIVSTALEGIYTKSHMNGKTLRVFNKELPISNEVLRNGLITRYAHQGHNAKALECFEMMQTGGPSPNAVTSDCILKAHGNIGEADKAHDIPVQILKNDGSPDTDAVVSANIYAKCGLPAKAQETFDKLPSWDGNTSLTRYMRHGGQTLSCVEQVQGKGTPQDAITFIPISKASGRRIAGNKGKEIHAQSRGEVLLEKDVVVGTALVDMYVKCGMLAEAQSVFDELPVQDVVLWNALISGYTLLPHVQEALSCFERMQLGRFSPDLVTFSCILKVCGSIGAVHKGQEIHNGIVRGGFLEKDTLGGNALVDMYANCGMVAEAQDMFDKLAVQDLVSWNALIAGYAQLGKSQNVFYLFDRMIAEGQSPDFITFTSMLTACSHMGLLDEGQIVLETMSASYGVNTTLEHYTCLVDSLGRAGCLDKMVAIVIGMPFSANLLMWHSVLGACQKWHDVELGKWAFEHAIRLDEKDVAAYVCMSNILVAAGRHEDAFMVEAMGLSR